MADSTQSNPWRSRHIGIQHFEDMFAFEHLPEQLQQISEPFHRLATEMVDLLGDGPELTTALRKLVEAKDCAVRQAVKDAKT